MNKQYFASLVVALPLLLSPTFAAAQSKETYSVGAPQLCTLDAVGQVDCIISRGYERLTPPTNLPNLIAVTVGDAHACGITMDGAPVCWGGNFFGQLNIPNIDASLVKINAGSNHTCAIDSAGEAFCWGLNTNQQLDVPAGARFLEIDAVDNSTCGILTNGDITCWTTDNSRAYERLEGPYTDLDTAFGIVCGLTESGSIECFLSGQRTIDSPNGGPYIDIAANFNAVCGLLTDGTLDCSINDSAASSEYPVGEQFLSIQSVESDSGNTRIRNGVRLTTGTTLCGQRLDGEIDCWAEGRDFPDFDNLEPTAIDLINTVELYLDAKVYDTNAVEIFWTPLPTVVNGATVAGQPQVEIYRNGVLIDTVLARFSYFDRRAVTDATYQIRLVDDRGNAGDLSGLLSVNTTSRTVLFNGEPTNLDPISEPEPQSDVFTDETYVSIFDGFVLSWQVDEEFEELIDGYEVVVNGVPVGFTRSKLYVSLSDQGCVEIIAYGFDGSRIDNRRVARSSSNCT